MKKLNYLFILPALLSLCSCAANCNLKITGNTSYILNDIKTSYEVGEKITLKTPSFNKVEDDVVLKVNNTQINPVIDDYAVYEFEIKENTELKFEINGKSDFKVIKDLDQYKDLSFDDIIKVEFSNFEHYLYNPRINHVSSNQNDIDLIISKFYSPVTLNEDGPFYGGNYRNFKLITSSGEVILLETYDNYTKDQEYRIYLNFENKLTHDSIYYNFGPIGELELTKNIFDSTSTKLNIDNIPFVRIETPNIVDPVLTTESIGVNFKSLEVYNENTFSLIGDDFVHYYQLIEHTFDQLIS